MDGTAYVDQAFLSYQSAQKPKAAMTPGSMTADKARAVSQDFEAFFVSRMIDSMFAGLSTDGPFGGGHGEKVFRSVMIQNMLRGALDAFVRMDAEAAVEIAKKGGFGISDMVQKQLMQMQEVAGEQ